MGGPEPGEDQKGSAMAQTSSASEGVPNDEAMATASPGREKTASKLVDRFALWSGVAGLVPLSEVGRPDFAVLQNMRSVDRGRL